MRQITRYQCEVCTEVFDNQIGCETHEAAHYGLTRKDYLTWRILCQNAAQAGKLFAVGSTPAAKRDFDRMVLCLSDFEREHGLGDKKKPHDFYL